MVTDAKRQSYADAGEALKTLGGDFNYWSQRLTDSSTQMCLAVIAGNWAYYSSAAAVMKSSWALLSLGIIFASLSFSLIVSYGLSELHRCAYYDAENDWAAWESRFKKYQRGAIKDDPWPATVLIERINIVARVAKMALPLIAGLVLVIGAFRQHLPEVNGKDVQSSQQTLLLNVSANLQSVPSPLEKHSGVTPMQGKLNGKTTFCR